MPIDEQIAKNLLKILREHPHLKNAFFNARFQESIINRIGIQAAQELLDDAIAIIEERKWLTPEQISLLRIQLIESPRIKGAIETAETIGKGISAATTLPPDAQIFASVTPEDAQMPEGSSAFGHLSSIPRESVEPSEILSHMAASMTDKEIEEMSKNPVEEFFPDIKDDKIATMSKKKLDTLTKKKSKQKIAGRGK